MSRFLFATSGADAMSESLAITAKSIRGLGLSRRPWFVTGVSHDAVAPLARRITLGDNPSAEWVIFLAAGDSVTRDALHVAATIGDTVGSTIDVIYGDTRHDIKRSDRLPTYQRRPSFSPERLRSHNYIGDFIMARRSLVSAAGGLEMLTSADAHDRNLRLTECARGVHRTTAICNVTPSDNLLPDANPEAVAHHLVRRGIDAEVEFDAETPAVRLRRRLRRHPKISVIIPTRGSSATLRGALTPFVVNAVRT
ncbi:MAG: hypothetical protein ACO3FC_03220, partial [Ilumatobacteraceae bacterium]